MKNNTLEKCWLKICLTCLILVLFSIATVTAGKIRLPDGQEVKVKFDPKMKVSSNTVAKGVPLLIHLEEPIEIGGVVIIEKDAPGTATVADVEKASKPGKPGKIKIEFTDLEPKGDYNSPDGNKVKLSGTIEGKGKGKKFLSYLFIAGLFIKGTEAMINTDSTYTATIAEPIILESK
jgi:hypothetical protein